MVLIIYVILKVVSKIFNFCDDNDEDNWFVIVV